MPPISVTAALNAKLKERGFTFRSGGVQSIYDAVQIETPSAIHGRLSGILSFGAYSYIGAPGQFRHTHVGRYCSIAGDVVCGEQAHPTDWMSSSNLQYGTAEWSGFELTGTPRFRSQEITHIGNDVWIGQGAFIRGGVTIGDGAIIAARSIVTKDVAPYAIVGGAPARLIRFRLEEKTRAELGALGWWNYSMADMQGCPFDDPPAAIVWLAENLPGMTPHKPEPIVASELLTLAELS